MKSHISCMCMIFQFEFGQLYFVYDIGYNFTLFLQNILEFWAVLPRMVVRDRKFACAAEGVTATPGALPQIWNHFQCSPTLKINITKWKLRFMQLYIVKFRTFRLGDSLLFWLLFLISLYFFLLQVTRTFQYVCKSWGQIANNCLRHCFPGSSMGKIVTQLLEHLCAPNIKWSPIDSPPTLHNTWRAYRSLYILIFSNLHKGKCRKYIIGALRPLGLNQIPAAMSIEEISWKISVFTGLK